MASMGCIVALPDKALFQGEITYANIPGNSTATSACCPGMS